MAPINRLIMKNTYILLLFALVQSSCSNVGQTAQPPSCELRKTDVLDALESFRLALLHPTEEQLLELTDAKLTYGHSSGFVEDRSSFIHSLVSKKFVFTALQFSDVSMELAGCTAIVRHQLHGQSADEGKPPGQVKLHVVLVWHKDQEGLRLLARQAVKL